MRLRARHGCTSSESNKFSISTIRVEKKRRSNDGSACTPTDAQTSVDFFPQPRTNPVGALRLASAALGAVANRECSPKGLGWPGHKPLMRNPRAPTERARPIGILPPTIWPVVGLQGKAGTAGASLCQCARSKQRPGNAPGLPGSRTFPETDPGGFAFDTRRTLGVRAPGAYRLLIARKLGVLAGVPGFVNGSRCTAMRKKSVQAPRSLHPERGRLRSAACS